MQDCVSRISAIKGSDVAYNFYKDWEFRHLPQRATLAADIGMHRILQDGFIQLKLNLDRQAITGYVEWADGKITFIHGPYTVSWPAN